ncbi:MAG TPA: TatD family hydrolase [Gammaproteobacteria bacterium]|nr:TatD family hydrolase [Gammaproteobacteria bacterium]
MLDLIDIGANLTHDSFDKDRDAVMARAAEAGVRRMLVTGASVTGSLEAAALAARFPASLYATAGIHPHHAGEFDEHSIPALRVLAAEARVVAIGECGLDFFRNFSPQDAQRLAFAAQLELAAETGLPAFLHQRDAHEPFMRILERHRAGLSGAVAHCFTGGPEELAAYLDLDLYVGITGWICDERRGAELRAALPRIPLDRLLLETDAPYLLPRDLAVKPRDRRNEPAYLPHILEVVARGLDRPAEDVARAATRNAETLFGLDASRIP